jgi:hypothetical protein
MLQRRADLKSWAIQGIAVALIIGVAWLFMDGPLAKHKLVGTLTVTDTAPGHPTLIMLDGGMCRTTGENDDIMSMAEVTVRDQNAVLLGIGLLSPGVAVDVDSCEFGFVVDVPSVEVYRFTIVGRGTVAYTHTELAKWGWEAGFSIGEE